MCDCQLLKICFSYDSKNKKQKDLYYHLNLIVNINAKLKTYYKNSFYEI